MVVTTVSSPLRARFPFFLTSHTSATDLLLYESVREPDEKKMHHMCCQSEPRCRGGERSRQKGPHVVVFFYQPPPVLLLCVLFFPPTNR